MVRIIIALLFCFPVALSAQTYQQLSEKAIECIEKDSFHRAEELLLQALKLEPKNAKNALLFSNLGLVQRRLGEYDKALESYSFALNFAPLAVPILLDRAAIYMETGRTDRAYTDYCRVLDEDKQNKEALLMRAYIYILRRDYPAARIDYNRLLELDPQSYSGRLGLATLEQKEEKFRESLDILNKMIVETPEDATLYVARADVEREMKHEDLALVDLEEAILYCSVLQPFPFGLFPVDVWYNRAVACALCGDAARQDFHGRQQLPEQGAHTAHLVLSYLQLFPERHHLPLSGSGLHVYALQGGGVGIEAIRV